MSDSTILWEKHVTAASFKAEAISGKEALLQTVLEQDRPDYSYIVALRKRIARLKVQSENMKPTKHETD